VLLDDCLCIVIVCIVRDRPIYTGMSSCTVQVVESITTVYCFVRADTEWHKAPVEDQVIHGALAAGVVVNSRQSLVALIATVVFSGFTMFIYFKAFLGFLLCQAKSALRKQQSNMQSGVDQRHIFQKIGGIFSNRYSKDAVNIRHLQAAEQEVRCPCVIVFACVHARQRVLG